MENQLPPAWILLTPSIRTLAMILINDWYLKRKIRRWRCQDEREHAEWIRSGKKTTSA